MGVDVSGSTGQCILYGQVDVRGTGLRRLDMGIDVSGTGLCRLHVGILVHVRGSGL